MCCGVAFTLFFLSWDLGQLLLVSEFLIPAGPCLGMCMGWGDKGDEGMGTDTKCSPLSHWLNL